MSLNNDSKPAGGSGSQHPLDRYSVPPQAADGGGGNDSPYYKSAAPSIALPKGGGALKGIDEKFSVNAVNGTAGLQVPLPLTPGRGGFTPALSLSYNSGSGNSPFGLGWNMGLPSIRRKTDKQLPLYDDMADSDTFLLAGAEDLVPKLKFTGTEWLDECNFSAGSYFIRCYRPRIEGLFARIENISKLGVTGSWWRVTTKDNIVTYYGLTAAGRIADPENAGRIFEWLPQLVFDARGNVQEYQYIAEDSVNVPDALHEQHRKDGLSPFSNTYLKKVLYCNQNPQFVDDATPYQPAMPADAGYLMEAVLDYGEHDEHSYEPGSSGWPCRTDAFSDFHAGFEIRTYRKCRRVLMFHRFAELNADASNSPVLVRALSLQYAQDGLTAMAEADLLLSAVQTGYLYDGSSDYTSKSLPAMTMSYQPLSWDTSLHTVAAEDMDGAPQGLGGAYQWTDLWGEGLPGILSEQAGEWFYKSNLGDAHFTPAMPVAEKPSFSGLGSGMQWQDLDADGRRQLVSYNLAFAGYFELNDDQEWEGFQAFKETVNVDWQSPYTKMLDLDGDGRPDLLLTEDNVWTWYANKGKEGFGTGGRVSVNTDEERAPRLLLNDAIQRIFLADMNGDGLTDLVRITNGEVCYWPNRGRGAFGAKVMMSNAPVFAVPDIYNPLYLHLADISGTGAPDLLYRNADGSLTAWINLAGNGFGEAVSLGMLPSSAPDTTLSVIDLLGSGTGCIVWSSPLPADAVAPMRYMDLMGGRKPYLMNSYYNGMGKTVAVTYRSSARYYLDDKAAGTPWATRLPFPVQCINEITTTDAVSETSYVQSYAYHHGYYDHEEREFRGFGRVDTLDTDSAAFYDTVTSGAPVADELDQSPVLTKTWYHTGAWMREGTLLDAFKEEYYQPAAWQEPPLHIQLPAGLQPQEQREAYRALKGMPLRAEVYAKDGSAQEPHPYTVTAYAYATRLVQPLETQRYAAFLCWQEESIAWSCERNPDDPRVAQSLTLDTDLWGNVTRSAQVVYPRMAADTSLPAIVQAEQGKMHITFSESAFTDDIINTTVYRLRLPCEAKSYELTGYTAPASGAWWTGDALDTAIAGAGELDFANEPSTGLQKRLLGCVRTLFRGNGGSAVLAFGTISSLALPHEQYHLAFTDKSRDVCFDDSASVLLVDGTMLAEGGYLQTNAVSGFPAVLPAAAEYDWYWLPSGTAQYSATPADDFYSPHTFTDPWGNVTSLYYWGDYYLLPEHTEDAVGNVTIVLRYNWHSLQPEQMADPNNIRTEAVYDALGMVAAMAMTGMPGSSLPQKLDGLAIDDAGDLAAQSDFWAAPFSGAEALLKDANWRCIYQLNGTGPSAVAMIARAGYYYGTSPEELVLICITYSDGFGRVMMQKAQTDPGEAFTLDSSGAVTTVDTGTTARWISSGRTIYNNKGKAVLQYEPYFSASHGCDTAVQAAAGGVSPRMHYDPLGRAYRTDAPDGSYSKVVWDSWQQKHYDANDTAADSRWYADRTGTGALSGIPEEADAAAKVLLHYDTPAVAHTDSLGRAFYTVQQYQQADSSNPDPFYHSYETLDIQGHRLSVHDARGLTPLSYRYTPLGVPARQSSTDSGTAMTYTAADGQPLYGWDADGTMTRHSYDGLRRPLRAYATAAGSSTEATLAAWIWGELIPNAALYGCRDKLVTHYDGSGMHSHYYDARGWEYGTNHYPPSANYTTRPDWGNLSSPAVDMSAGWGTFSSIGVLGMPVYTINTRSGPSYRYLVTNYQYDRGSALRGVNGAGGPPGYIQGGYCTTDALGRPVKQSSYNNTTTTNSYHPLTHRLTRQLTTRSSDNRTVQDFRYFYDAAGNITLRRDEAQQAVFYANTIAYPENDYTYDALYRLIKAGGREHAGSNAATSWNDSTRMGTNTQPLLSDETAMRPYIQYYEYDEAGNMVRMRHTTTGGTGNWTRSFITDSGSNRMTGMWMGTTMPASPDESYSYDGRGNMLDGMSHLQSMGYNELSQLEHLSINSSRDGYYQYNGDGQRWRKTVISTSGGVTTKEERCYQTGGVEEYIKTVGGSITLERQTHRIQGAGANVLIERRLAGTGAGEAAEMVRYQYGDQLNSCGLELDETGDVISYEEYYPFGSTSFQSGRTTAEVSLKRYRYTGKERDEESGLNYHGARYYAPWLCRWTQMDPKQVERSTLSPYNYCQNDPVNRVDMDGMKDEHHKQKKHHSHTHTKIHKISSNKHTIQTPLWVGLDIDVPGLMTSKGKTNLIQSIKHSNVVINPLPNIHKKVKIEISDIARKLLNNMYQSEGGYVNRSDDPGGATKFGIAQKREWPIAAKLLNLKNDTTSIKNLTSQQADTFYVTTRMEPYKINEIKNEKIANAILDQSVLTPGIINKNVKKALNDLGYKFSANSSKLSTEQVNAINAVDSNTFVSKFADHQLEYFESLKGTQVYKTNINGWKNRLDTLKAR